MSILFYQPESKSELNSWLSTKKYTGKKAWGISISTMYKAGPAEEECTGHGLAPRLPQTPIHSLPYPCLYLCPCVLSHILARIGE